MVAAANRGKKAEKAVHTFLKEYSNSHYFFDFDRIPDARGGSRTKKIGDFQYFVPAGHGVIEVKETEHDYRLDRSRLTQLPMMRKRELAGGVILVLVYHSTEKVWRCPDFEFLCDGQEGGSWDLRGIDISVDVDDILEPIFEGMF